jgi:hypothetical protein
MEFSQLGGFAEDDGMRRICMLINDDDDAMLQGSGNQSMDSQLASW